MVQEKVRWDFEPTHCKIGFSVRHFGISETEGFFRKFSGTIDYEKQDFSDAKVELNIDVASIDTQEKDRDAHLLSPDFFNAAQYPGIHFKSTKMEVTDPNHYKMFGDLTMVGVTKQIVLDVEFGGIVEKDPFGNTKAGFLITGKINRKDWGITWNRALDFGGVAVGETVKLNCHIELLKSELLKQRVWFVTGISSGLGKALAQTVIEQGDFVVGTFRSQTQADTFNKLYKNKAFALALDITKSDQIESAFKLIKEKFGSVDVMVNNAGFGFAGAIEETSTEEVREIFEANFLGTLKLTQTFLPLFREQKRGHIIQISSHGGFKAFAGFGIYNASKFAVEGFSEALAQEIAPLGIKLTIVEPGPFRTKFAGASFRQSKASIDDYVNTAGLFKERMKQVDGKQEGDPEKAAKAIFDITKLDTPPLRLPLGKIALLSLTTKLESVQKDLYNYRSIAENVVF